MGQRIEITSLDDTAFGVTVTEGDTSTSHRVRVPEDLLDGLGLAADDRERLVRESFEFLLEREPASSILGDFDLDRIGHYFPEYHDEIRARLAS